MEPQSPQSSPSPEMGAYHAPETPMSAGEALPQKPEQSQVRAEREPLPQQAPAAMPIQPAPQLPVLPTPQTPSSSVQTTRNDTNPLLASDEDLIEKEWVDKAKKIVAQTKDDPFTQEKEVSKLQADYLKKRYGKEIKLSSE